MNHGSSLHRAGMFWLSGLLCILTVCGGCKSAPDSSSTTSQPTPEPMPLSEQRTYSLKLDTPLELDDGHAITVGMEGHEELAPAPDEVDQFSEHVLIYTLTITHQGMPTITHRYLEGTTQVAALVEVLVGDRGFALTLREDAERRQGWRELIVTPHEGAPITQARALDMARAHPTFQACLRESTGTPTVSTGSWVGSEEGEAHQGLISLAHVYAEPSSPPCQILLGVYSGLYIIGP